jgi:hypothetical protein
LRQDNCDPVTGFDAQCVQRVGQLARLLMQFTVRKGQGARARPRFDNRRTIAMGICRPPLRTNLRHIEVSRDVPPKRLHKAGIVIGTSLITMFSHDVKGRLRAPT